MKKYFIIVVLLLVVGCNNKEQKQKIEIKCNGVITNVEVKKNDVINCKLLNEDYKFKITKINKNKIYIEVNEYGLTDKGDLIEKNKKFILNSDKDLELTTQSEDYQEKIIFLWK